MIYQWGQKTPFYTCCTVGDNQIHFTGLLQTTVLRKPNSRIFPWLLVIRQHSVIPVVHRHTFQYRPTNYGTRLYTETHNNLQYQHKLSRHVEFTISSDFVPRFLTVVLSTHLTYCLKFGKISSDFVPWFLTVVLFTHLTYCLKFGKISVITHQ